MTSVIDHLLTQRVPFVVLPAPQARSPREAAEAHGVDVAELVRTEVIVTTGGPVAVVIRSGDRFELALARGAVRDAVARMATASEIHELARECDVDALPPLSAYLFAPVYVDAPVAALEQIVFPAGRSSALVCTRRADLFQAQPVTVAALSGASQPAAPVLSVIAPSRRVVLTDAELVPAHMREGSPGGGALRSA
ncbi:MAG: YbaK/EbsC family protein [Actinomycetota bacterium]